MIYYLSRDYKSNRINDAGSKARLDVEQVMDQLGFSPAGKHHSITKNRLFHFVRTIAIVVRMLLYVNKGDVLILQYPTKKGNCFCENLDKIYKKIPAAFAAGRKRPDPNRKAPCRWHR